MHGARWALRLLSASWGVFFETDFGSRLKLPDSNMEPELALWELHSLLAPGEYVWLFGTHYPHLPELLNEGTLECVQMVLTRELDAKPSAIDLLSAADADAMVALTDVAFPGFFWVRF